MSGKKESRRLDKRIGKCIVLAPKKIRDFIMKFSFRQIMRARFRDG